MTKVFAQKNKEGEWISIPVFISVKAFDERGYEIVPYIFENIKYLNITPDDIVVGGIPCVRSILSRFEIVPPILSIPDERLSKFCNRNFRLTTIPEVNKAFMKEDFKKIFIKPYKEHKLFNGHVVNEFKDLFKSMHVPENVEVVSSDVVDFVSEYRVFVTNGKIVGISHYCGNPLVFPDSKVIEELVAESYSVYGLEGFSVDVGVTSSNQTLLVELNDGFSLGVYGLNYFVYSKLIEERWKQLMKNVSVDSKKK